MHLILLQLMLTLFMASLIQTAKLTEPMSCFHNFQTLIFNKPDLRCSEKCCKCFFLNLFIPYLLEGPVMHLRFMSFLMQINVMVLASLSWWMDGGGGVSTPKARIKFLHSQLLLIYCELFLWQACYYTLVNCLAL